MSINRYQINLNNFLSGSTASINIPINMQYQLVDNSELIETEFVDNEVNKAINPIIDYEKVRFIPLDQNGIEIANITYNVNVLNGSSIVIPTMYSNLGFVDDDIKFKRNFFKETFLLLRFYDNDIPFNQTLSSDISIFTMITSADINPIGSGGSIGQPKPVNQIPVRFTLENPLKSPMGFSEGYHLYDFKSSYQNGLPRHLFMKAFFVNAKSGKIINLMTEPTPYPIDQLVHKLYTRYDLIRTNTGFFYEINSSYSNNVLYTNNPYGGLDVNVNLYQIQAI